MVFLMLTLSQFSQSFKADDQLKSNPKKTSKTASSSEGKGELKRRAYCQSLGARVSPRAAKLEKNDCRWSHQREMGSR